MLTACRRPRLHWGEDRAVWFVAMFLCICVRFHPKIPVSLTGHAFPLQADKCLSYALKFNLSDPELLSNIAFYYLSRLDLATAEKLLRLSIQCVSVHHTPFHEM